MRIMKKHLIVVVTALFISIFIQPQSLFAYYPCSFAYPGETGNCEGCGELSPTDCHKDCAPTWSGYNCSQMPRPVSYCSLYQEYSFAVTPSVQQCVCPTGSSMVDSNAQVVGVHRFRCVIPTPAPYPTPAPQPQPVTSCAVDTTYFFNFSQKQCACPTDSYKVVHTGYGLTGGESFVCKSYYQPLPMPAPVVTQTCWNGTVIPSTSSCPSAPVCLYNQYWSGYECVDYYQSYSPVYQPVSQYSFVYSWQYDTPQNYTYNWSGINSAQQVRVMVGQ